MTRSTGACNPHRGACSLPRLEVRQVQRVGGVRRLGRDHPAARATGRWTFGPWTRRRRQAIPIHDGRPHGAVPAVL